MCWAGLHSCRAAASNILRKTKPMFEVHRTCGKSMARLSTLTVSTSVSLPTFMPVATYGAMKAVHLGDLDNELILANTYHCRHLGNLKELSGWKRALLTDSGGFQIGSLRGATVVEKGVIFPESGEEEEVFTPEQSICIQNRLGADIIMQLDDVVQPSSPRVEEAMWRSLRWLKRCMHVHKTSQLLFPIVQGGLDLDLRTRSLVQILETNPAGIAIGGLCGGESKKDFCRVVYHCTRAINATLAEKHGAGSTASIPIYVMGVGYPEDVVVCVALGCDMMDCVYPTRTARFGTMLTDAGDINVNKRSEIAKKGVRRQTQNSPCTCAAAACAEAGGDTEDVSTGSELFNECECSTCARYSLQYLHSIRGTTNFCMLLTAHNLHYMSMLGRRMREALKSGSFPEFVSKYMKKRFAVVPEWIVEALEWVSIGISV